MKVKASDTIGSIKVKIQAIEPIPFDQQELIYNKIACEDMDTIANLQIKKNAIFTLVLKSTGFITIHVDTLLEDITVKLKPSDSIKSIKSKSKLGSYDPGILLFNDVVVEGTGTLADFNIVEGSVLEYVFKEMRKMEVFVKTYNGKTLTLDVHASYTIDDVKCYIADEEDILYYEQVLIYNEMVLHDSGTLFDFNVTDGSTLTLMRRHREFEGFMHINIKTRTAGETITLEVKPYAIIGDIKLRIQDEVGVPCDEQELIFNEMVTDDECSLADFHIENGSTLTLMRISKGFMRIYIKSYTRESETYTLDDVRPSDTILDVKSKFSKKNYIAHHARWRLYFNEKLLEDSATLAHYHISAESTIYFER